MEPVLLQSSSTITTEFRFDDVPLRVTIGARAFRLFGRADILVDRRTWRVDAIQVFSLAPGDAPTAVLPGTECHETLCVALAMQFGDDIDELVADTVERRGGYMVLFGERMPAAPAFRGVPAYRPVASLVRDMGRTFHL